MQPENNLLGALRPADRAILAPWLESVELATGEVLYEVGDQVERVYFPCGPALVSFMVAFADGKSAETALIGCEGAIGGIVSQGKLPAFARSIVQHGGRFLRMPIARLAEAKAASPALAHLFARYADCVVAQIFQAVACNATHNIEHRLARWLLATLDRTGQRDVPVTQERLAATLGVGRGYVTRVVTDLRAAGLVDTRRGGVAIVDPEALGWRSCDCNAAIRRHFDLVLKGVYPDETGA
ncbi:Crp/Fnr family transcriptional regulator [alpha proteobacterium AAP81b]|nr:Crp/Fnr family transcriptional regulator [alpha proteobacterium AAP81b]